MIEDFLWTEKYRPRTISEMVLPEELKKTLQSFVDQKNVPNLLLFSSAGSGKTTAAKAVLNELGCDYIIINGSNEGRLIDTLRTKIQNFASGVSFVGGRKYVILDEADHLGETIQSALRNFMEEYSSNCGFILTCNFPNKIIKPLHSRCSVIDFKIPRDKMPSMAGQMFSRVQTILTENGIEFEKKVVAEVINKFFPDNRRILNELQRYSVVGKIDSGILVNFSDEGFDSVFEFLKEKKFNEVRKWVAHRSYDDQSLVFRKIYDTIAKKAKPQSVPQIVVTLADYQYKSAFVVDQEINLMACLTEIMMDAEWQ
jgi:DNA polymerase III delta prime subunit